MAPAPERALTGFIFLQITSCLQGKAPARRREVARTSAGHTQGAYSIMV